MSLKNDSRRPVPDWLQKLDPATLNPTDFSLPQILEHSLYYPAAGTDGRPVQFLGGFIHSFIYVDYGMSEPVVDENIREFGFSGYHLAASVNLAEKDITPNGWRPIVPQKFEAQMQSFQSMAHRGFVKKTSFAKWYIFDLDEGLNEEHGPQRFSLLHLCADGVATYQALYYTHKTAPEVLTIIQPGTGYGGNYTNFTDPEGFFAWVVLLGNDSHIPEYLVCGGMLMDYTDAFWPEAYPDHVEWFQHKHGNGVWRRAVNS